MPLRLFAALAVLSLSACANTRGSDVGVPSLAHLHRHASEASSLNLGPIRLGLARWVLGKIDDPEAAALLDALKACKTVQLRHYEFASDFQYPVAGIEAFRKKLSGRGWSSLARMRDRKAGDEMDVYVRLEHEKITGFVFLAIEPREFTLIKVVGSIDAEQIDRLRTQFSAQARGKSKPSDAPAG